MEEKCLNLINYANHQMDDDDQLQGGDRGCVGDETVTAGAAASNTTTDATTHEINNKIHHHINHLHHNRIDSTGTGIFLETPIIEENTISMNSHDYENAKPKRLSDEFLSQSSDEDQLLHHTTASSDAVAVLESLKEEGDSDHDDVIEDDEDDVEDDRPEDEEGDDEEEDDEDEEEDDNLTTDSDVQSMDAIERRDFEHEQRLTGGRIMRLSSLTDGNNCLKLNLLSNKNGENNEPSPAQASSVSASGSKSANSSDYGTAGTSGVNDRIVSSDSKVGVFYFS